jgi:alpha-L-fucosidase
MHRYGHTIYGTHQGCVPPQYWGAVTAKDKTQYIHILNKEITTLTLNIPGFHSARWLNNGSKPAWRHDKKSGDVTFTFNGLPDEVDVVIEVQLLSVKKY